MPGGLDNALRGDFGESLLHAAASGCGLQHGRPDTVDLDKADVLLTLREELPGTYFPSVKVQVKTEVDLQPGDDGTYTYNLDVKTYNVLRRTDHSIRRILAVFSLKPNGPLIELQDDGTLLNGRGAWVSLEGAPPTFNTHSIAVKLPVENTIDPEGLRRMLTTYGVRISTPVPDVELWCPEPQQGAEGGQS